MTNYFLLTLSERKWVCPNCESVIDRDENAVINLRTLGIGYIHQCTLNQNDSSARKRIN